MSEIPNGFLQTKVSWGIIIRGDLSSIEEIKRFIAQIPDIRVAYQKTSFNKLWIVDKERDGQ